MKDKKKNYGQFFTVNSKAWLKEHIKEFILQCPNKDIILDPFAGGGDLLRTCKEELSIIDLHGYDIDKSLGWEINDSLLSIPKTDRLIVTNPPYLHKSRACERGLDSYKYFKENNYTDLYQIAIKRILDSHDYAVAIVPESFLRTKLFRDRLHSITVLEDNPFSDTTFPVCVACFTPYTNKIKIYKNEIFIGYLENLLKLKKKPSNKYDIKFNLEGAIGIKCIDGELGERIYFCKKEDLKHQRISRAYLIVDIHKEINIEKVIKTANEILNKHRKQYYDLLLTAFYGNNKNGIRNRILNRTIAKAILEESIMIMEKEAS